jgi:cytochrome c553
MDGSMTAAAAKAAECFACQGPDGNRVVPALPRRAGRSGVCIAGQWRLFRSGVRPSPVTGPMARTLSKQDLDHLAVFVASHVQGLR